MGLKTAAVVSDGRRLENQKPLALHRKRLGTLQRRLSRKQKIKDPETGKTKFSKNYEKQRVKVARKHQQIASIRADVQHKFTTELARTAGAIGIEDLHILGMMANRKFARAVADAAMGQLLAPDDTAARAGLYNALSGSALRYVSGYLDGSTAAREYAGKYSAHPKGGRCGDPGRAVGIWSGSPGETVH